MVIPLVFLAFLAAPARSSPLSARSGPERARLVELFSSEGCSSCPPADAWVSSLRRERTLWKAFVPVVFHVTYWDYLGWTDALADRRYTARQRAYAAAWGTASVYTPGFVLDGAEWRGWGRGAPQAGGETGTLEVSFDGKTVAARFSPASGEGPFTLHAARLGFGVERAVEDGENAGRNLRHDFVALSLAEAPLKHGADGWRGSSAVPAAKFAAPSQGFAAWVTDGDGRVVQAAGASPP